MSERVFDCDGAARKPAGGFCFVSGTALLAAWMAYRRGDLRLADLRAWFACFEAVARRCRLAKGRSARYTIEEIHRLVGGVGGEHTRRSITRLERAGLLCWSETEITFPKLERGHILLGDPELDRMMDLVTNHCRPVPVPRRIIRIIAGGVRPVVVATIIGHLLRCLYYRQGACLPDGTCKASWIADVFGVDVRNVKSARKYLVTIGWLVPIETKQVHLNRWGQRMRVNLEWPGTTEACNDGSGKDIMESKERSPLRGFSTTGSPPPYKDKQLSPRAFYNQKPAPGPSGVFEQEGGRQSRKPVEQQASPGIRASQHRTRVLPSHAKAERQPREATHVPDLENTGQERRPKPGEASCRWMVCSDEADMGKRVPNRSIRTGRPSLRHIVPEDLDDATRLLDLLEQAASLSFVNRCECDRLRFFAAAERAKARGTRNPCGLFATIVRQNLWSYITHDEEDIARRRLTCLRDSSVSTTWAPLWSVRRPDVSW